MRVKRSLLLMPLAVSFLLSGCSINLTGADLLHPPKTTGNEAEIEQLIEKTADDSYMLKYPQSGQYRSAIITEDLDGDNKDEAFAFYRTEGDKPVTHMLIMCDDGEKWKISCNYETPYTDVDCIQFADYDYDGVEEIFAGFVTYTGGANELKIFDFNKENFTAQEIKFSKIYSSFTTGDYDQDGASEILTFSLNSSNTKARAELTDYDKNQLYTLSGCDMDPNVTRFESVTSGLISENNVGVVIDGFLTDSYNSQVIFYDVNKARLINSPYTTGKKLNPTERTFRTISKDINEDGFIEIPELTTPTTDADSNKQTAAPVVTWCSFDTKSCKFIEDMRCITNFEFGYYFTLPDNLVGTTAALLSNDNKTMKIYELKGKAIGNLLITFKVFDVSTSSDKLTQYTNLESYNQYNYTYKIEDYGTALIDDTTVRENFALNDVSV